MIDVCVIVNMGYEYEYKDDLTDKTDDVMTDVTSYGTFDKEQRHDEMNEIDGNAVPSFRQKNNENILERRAPKYQGR
jgi:hypothetical protein